MGEVTLQNEVHIKIGADGIDFYAKGDSDFIERERNAFEAKLLPLGVDAVTRTRNVVHMPQITACEYPSLPQPTYDAPVMSTQNAEEWNRTSLAAFAKKKGAVAHYDFILCAVVYNEKKNGITAFSSNTLKELYSDAKRPMPGNISMSLSELVKKGLIMENSSAKSANPKEYVLTSDGEEFVNQMQPKDGAEKKPNTKPRKSRPTVESEYAQINVDELNLGSYPAIKSMKDFKEKMLLTLYIVTKENRGEWFSTADVMFLLTSKFGEPATKDQVKGVFKNNKTWFHTKNTEGNKRLIVRKLLNGGFDFAKSLIGDVNTLTC